MYIRDAGLIIRRAVYADAPFIIQAHIRSIREVCASDYTAEQIAAWSGRDFQVSHWLKTMDRDLVWVLSNDKNEVFGFGHMDPKGHIAGLYFVPEVIGLGFGRKLVDLMKTEAQVLGLNTLELSATKTAVDFYRSMGFSIIENSFVQMSDQKIDCFKMVLEFTR